MSNDDVQYLLRQNLKQLRAELDNFNSSVDSLKRQLEESDQRFIKLSVITLVMPLIAVAISLIFSHFYIFHR